MLFVDMKFRIIQVIHVRFHFSYPLSIRLCKIFKLLLSIVLEMMIYFNYTKCIIKNCCLWMHASSIITLFPPYFRGIEISINMFQYCMQSYSVQDRFLLLYVSLLSFSITLFVRLVYFIINKHENIVISLIFIFLNYIIYL